MPVMPLLLPIFKLARSRSLPFVPIRPLLAPVAVAPVRSDARIASARWRRIAS